jgi:hypothetical protein
MISIGLISASEMTYKAYCQRPVYLSLKTFMEEVEVLFQNTTSMSSNNLDPEPLSLNARKLTSRGFI